MYIVLTNVFFGRFLRVLGGGGGGGGAQNPEP
jgi:hypothetical protein